MGVTWGQDMPCPKATLANDAGSHPIDAGAEEGCRQAGSEVWWRLYVATFGARTFREVIQVPGSHREEPSDRGRVLQERRDTRDCTQQARMQDKEAGPRQADPAWPWPLPAASSREKINLCS